mmetsp:Transcript_40865/g.80638  ORF Transcript_40865/g.80638 Transcript_40865/m.80638 type:complete len:158 (+) Transcript_40865:70-543(+)
MHPASYHPDGTGRDLGVYHTGTRVSGAARHVNAQDSATCFPRLSRSAANRHCSSYFPVVGNMATRSTGTVTPRSGVKPEFWSQAAYSSTYRDHHSDPAAQQGFNPRHSDANTVRATLFGTPDSASRRPPPRSMITRSTCHAHFAHGGELERPYSIVP